MRYTFIYCLLFLGLPFLQAQPIEDIYWEQLQEESIKALQKEAYQEGLYYANKAYQHALNKKNPKLEYQSLRLLSGMYHAMGNIHAAIHASKKSIQLAKKNPRVAPESYLKDFALLGKLHLSNGQYKEARLVYEELLGLMQHQKNSIEYLECLNELSGIYLVLNEEEQALKGFEEAARIVEAKMGKNNRFYANCLNRLVYFHQQTGNHQKSLEYGLDALNIWGQIAKKQHPIYAFGLNNIAISYQHLHQFSQAEQYYKKALDCYRQIYSEAHPNCVSIRNNLGILYEQSGQLEKAASFLLASSEDMLQQLSKYYKNVNEQERLQFYRNQIGNNLDAFYSFVSRHPNPVLLRQLQRLSLYTKHAASYRSEQLKKIIEQSQDQELKELYWQWIRLRRYISYIYGLEKLEQAKIDLAQLELEARGMEQKMIEKSISVSQSLALQEELTDHQELHQILNKNEVSIDFIHFHYHGEKGWTDSIHYYAILTKSQDSLPKFIKLCNHRTLQQVLRYEVGIDPIKMDFSTSYISYVNLNKKLYKALWKPLEPHLKDIQQIHLSPSGWLCQVAFDALLIGDDVRFLADQYELQYYGTLRDFIHQAKDSLGTEFDKTALLVGAVDFDAKLLNEKTTAPFETSNSMEMDYELLEAPVSEGWPFLKSTQKEVEFLKDSLESNGYRVRLFAGEEAQEERLTKALYEKAPRILHIATHGYFIPASKWNTASANSKSMRDRLSYERHSLWRSGLMLAGCNPAWTGQVQSNGLNDGILPAYDIAAMNLQQTELVVLSACQTGRGDIDHIEGVWGLQSAFRQAGVRYQLLSLWNVSDEAAATMMQLFYKHYLSGKAVPEAFALARAEMRQLEDYRHPFFWAPFILIR